MFWGFFTTPFTAMGLIVNGVKGFRLSVAVCPEHDYEATVLTNPFSVCAYEVKS